MWTHSIYFLQLNLFNWIEGWHLVYTLSTTQSTIIDAKAGACARTQDVWRWGRDLEHVSLLHNFTLINLSIARLAVYRTEMGDACTHWRGLHTHTHTHTIHTIQKKKLKYHSDLVETWFGCECFIIQFLLLRH